MKTIKSSHKLFQSEISHTNVLSMVSNVGHSIISNESYTKCKAVR